MKKTKKLLSVLLAALLLISTIVVPSLFAGATFVLEDWDGTDDFSDPDKTAILWTNNLYENITEDGSVLIPNATYYSLNDGVLAEGDKLSALHFDLARYTSNTNKFFDLYLLGSNTGPYIRLNTHGLYYDSWSWTYGPNINGTDWTLKSTVEKTVSWNKNNHINGKVSVNYNWENWTDETKDVTVTFNLLNNEGSTITYELIYTYNGAEESPVFNIGFYSDVKNWYKIDNAVVISLSRAEEKAALYGVFQTTHADALAYDYTAGNTDYDVEKCRAMVEEYNALDSYTKTLFSETQVTKITNAADYVEARDYVTNHQGDVFAENTSEVAVEAMRAAINEYDALEDAVKAFITEAEKTQIEKMRSDAVVAYYVDKFKTDHAVVLALTEDTVKAENEEAVLAAIAEYDAFEQYIKDALAEQIKLLKTLRHHIIAEINLGGWDGTDDFSKADKTAILWTNNLADTITDAQAVLAKNTAYALNNGVLAENDKPIKLIFDATIPAGNHLRILPFAAESGYMVEFNNAGSGISFSGRTDWSLVTSNKGTIYNSNKQIYEGQITVAYDWSKWDAENKQVSLTVTSNQSGASVYTATATYQYTGDILPTDFTVGLYGGNSDGAIADNVLVVTESMHPEKVALYEEFKTAHADAFAYDFTAETVTADVAVCKAMLEGYKALDPYVQSLFTVEDVTQLTNVTNYVAARDFVTNHQSDIFAENIDEVAIDTMLEAIEEYDALDDSVKAFITEAEKAQVETTRNDVAVVYYVDKFKTDHAAVLALTEDTVKAENEEAILAAIAEYDTFKQYIKDALAEEITLLKALRHYIVVGVKLNDWDGTDDFSDAEKSSVIWSNILSENITDGAFVLPKSTYYSLNDGVLEDGEKLMALHFDLARVTSNTTAYFKLYLLGSNTGPYIQVDTHWLNYNGSGSTYGMTGSDWTLKQKVQSSVNWTKGNHVNAKITVDYDWSAWAESKDVTITFNLLNSDGSTITYELIYTYNGTEQSPDFNIGFNSVQNKWYKIDNVLVETANVLKHPKASEGSLLTDDEKILLSLDFDFSNTMKYAEIENTSIAKYGIIAIAGQKDIKEFKANGALLLDDDKSNNPAKYTVLETVMEDGDFVPENYFVTVTNSSEEEENGTSRENIGKRVSAIAYVVYEKDGVKTIAYSKDIIYASPIGLLKKEFNEKILPDNTASDAIVAGSALEAALNSYNTANSTNATLETILEAVNATTETTAEQKDLLIELYLSVAD